MDLVPLISEMQFIHKPTIMGGHAGRIPIVYDADNDIAYYGDNGGNHTDIMWGAFGAKGYLDKKLMHMDLCFLTFTEDGKLKATNGTMQGSKQMELENWCRQNLQFENYSHVADYDFSNSVLLSPEAAKHNALHGAGQAFGYVNGQLFFGINHSKITTAMIKNGWDFQTLLAAPQIWGWVRGSVNERYQFSNGDPAGDGLDISFGSDDKWMENHTNAHLKDDAIRALDNWWTGTHLARRGARNWT